MVMEAAAHGDMRWLWFILLFASAGVFHHAGIKIPFFAFYSHDSGIRCKEAPKHMLLAMGISAVLCILIGCFPQYLYSMLPYATDYQPYSISHVLAQSQLLIFSALAFTLLLLAGIYPAEIRSVNVDADWIYRKGGRQIYRFCRWAFDGINEWANHIFARQLPQLLAHFFEEPGGNLQRYGYRLWVESSGVANNHEKVDQDIDRRSRSATYPVGVSVLLAVVILALVSTFLYLR
jgi:multicomponent Na+:H+ antiporter subunit D